MTITLFELIRDVASHVGALVEGVATGGSTTTIIDTVVRTEPDDYWNGGDALIIYDAGGAGAAPQGEIKRITDFVSSTSTITAGTFTAAGETFEGYAWQAATDDHLCQIARVSVTTTCRAGIAGRGPRVRRDGRRGGAGAAP